MPVPLRSIPAPPLPPAPAATIAAATAPTAAAREPLNQPTFPCLPRRSLAEAGPLQNSAKAVKWYTKAAESFRKEAENDDPDAQWRLGLMYHSGQGVTKNEAEAQKWYLESG